jgi:hypothetical protein
MALQAPPDRREVAGWETALTVYRELADWPGTPGRRASRRPRSVASLLGPRVAAAAGAAAIAVLGGGAAAAYTGSLPAAVQKFAHVVIAAPGVHESTAGPAPEGTGPRVGPSARDGAAYGLCNAYRHANASQRAVAFRNLVNAAGGGRAGGGVLRLGPASRHYQSARPPRGPDRLAGGHEPRPEADRPAGQADDHHAGPADHHARQRKRKRERRRKWQRKRARQQVVLSP